MKQHLRAVITVPAAMTLSTAMAACGTSSSVAGQTSATPASSASQSPAATSTAGFEFANLYAFAAPAGMDVSAVYATITNTGTSADTLVSASTPVARETMVHRTVATGHGAGSMQHMASLPLPPHGTLVLRPGGNHIMLMQLTGPLEVGRTIAVTLTFGSGRSVVVQVPVIARDQRP